MHIPQHVATVYWTAVEMTSQFHNPFLTNGSSAEPTVCTQLNSQLLPLLILLQEQQSTKKGGEDPNVL
jgi:hypothetical protein